MLLEFALSQIPISVSSKNRINPESLKPIWLCLLTLLYEILKVAFAWDTECYELLLKSAPAPMNATF